MVDATIARARGAVWRVWDAPGPAERPEGRPAEPCASRARAATDAASIGDVPIPRPRAASRRPEAGALVASTI
jgi:hypothetical protein